MILTKEHLRKVEACSPLLPNPGPEVVEELLGHIWSMQAEFDKRIADLERQRDTAHAAAIQAAASKCCAGCASDHHLEGDIHYWIHPHTGELAMYDCSAQHIRALTPAGAQRLYDLRISEAVRHRLDQVEREFLASDIPNDGLYELLRRHIASVSAEVERLKEK